MKEGILMEQTLLSEVQERLSQIKKLKEEVTDTQKQIGKKEQEIHNFYQEWQDTCPHAFYRVQHLDIIPITVGYRCCLCGEYQNAQYPPTAPTRPLRSPINYIEYMERRRRKARPPMKPPSDINAPNFIGTVIDGPFVVPSYPIPPEYQAQVDSKNEQLSKLQAEKGALEEKLKSLESSIKISEKELDDVAHLLNQYFGYPKTVYESVQHWDRDDYSYDPIFS